MRPDHKPWTPEDLDELRRLWPIKTIDQIAEALGRSYLAVKGTAQRFGLPSRRGVATEGRQAEDRTLTELWAKDGLTRDDIAKAVGRSLSHINRRAEELGLGPRTDYGKRKPHPRKERGADLNTQTDAESVGRALMVYDSTWHLVDFKRAGYSAAYYQRHCEMPAHIIAREPCLRERVPMQSLSDHRSYAGSSAAMCAEMSR